MSTSRLAASIKAKLLAAPAGAVDNAALQAMVTAFAEAIVEEVTANASVVPTALVAPNGGGPVTGTGSVT